MLNAASDKRLILGTAGHIDHGKTALVGALTGVDTDRLPEEQRRGVTIDLGFAELDTPGAKIGVVDVPGHERFVKNMLAGASGVDIAMLVVAADDAVMPQTIEHLAILALLGVPRGIVAITKADLADDEWLGLLEEDIRAAVRGTMLESAPIVRTSSKTGEGIQELIETIGSVAKKTVPKPASGVFRLSVDRSFTLQGRGTVVTGTVASGVVRAGEDVAFMPSRRPVRVRSLQTHGRDATEARAGQRAALNLAGIHHSEVERGNVLAEPGYLVPSRCLTVRLRALNENPRPIRHRERVRMHVGAQEVLASVRLYDKVELEQGEEDFVQLFTTHPVCAVARQAFVLRSESPLATIGGGVIVQPAAAAVSRRKGLVIERLEALLDEGAATRAGAAVYGFGLQAWTAMDLCRDADLAIRKAVSVRDRLRNSGVVVVGKADEAADVEVHAERAGEVAAAVIGAMEELHAAAPLERLVPVRRLQQRLGHLDADALGSVVRSMRLAGELKGDAKGVALLEHEVEGEQAGLRTAVLGAYRLAAFAPPDIKALAQELQVGQREVRAVCGNCVDDGCLVHLGDGVHLHADVEQEARRRIRERLDDGGAVTMGELRELLGTSRKYALPIAGYFDQVGFTVRRGDTRVLADPNTG